MLCQVGQPDAFMTRLAFGYMLEWLAGDCASLVESPHNLANIDNANADGYCIRIWTSLQSCRLHKIA